jgi:hypothetical protein
MIAAPLWTRKSPTTVKVELENTSDELDCNSRLLKVKLELPGRRSAAPERAMISEFASDETKVRAPLCSPLPTMIVALVSDVCRR